MLLVRCEALGDEDLVPARGTNICYSGLAELITERAARRLSARRGWRDSNPRRRLLPVVPHGRLRSYCRPFRLA
jgi:hypothetical protein